MKKWRQKATILLLSTLILLQGLHVHAQTLTFTFPDPYLNYEFVNDTLIVDSTFYRIEVNTTTGIITMIVSKTDQEYDLHPEGVPPLVLAYAPAGGAGEETLNLTLVEFGNVTVVDYGRGVLAIEFSDPQVEGFEGSMTLIIDYTKPYLDVVASIPKGTTALVLAADMALADQWALAYSSFQGDVLNVYTTTSMGATTVAGSLEAAVMAGIAVENETTVLRYVYGYASLPGYKGPDLIGMFNKSLIRITGYNPSDNTIALGAIFYPASQTMVALRVSLFHYDPYAVLASGLLRPVQGLYDGVLGDVKPILYYTRFAEAINATIENLRSQVDQLREENRNLSKQLAEMQGCESYWKTELEKARMDLDRVQSQLQRMGAVSIAAFIIGIILGVAGGVYVFEGVRAAARKR